MSTSADRPVPAPQPELAELPELPGVSFVMPVLNEEGYLADAVAAVLAQDYAGEKELVLALGPSADASSAIAAEIAAGDPRVRLVDNPAADIPIGLNLAIAASRHPVIVRVDAHSELVPEYTALAVAALRRTGAANVGGIMRADGKNPVQRAIARGYNSPVGLGGGAYHGDGAEGPAESAYLGVFRREPLLAVGGFDAGIRRGEDWELNLRLRRAGYTVWFEPRLRVTYWPRASYGALARQFFATGVWRAVLVRRYGGANPWRFFVPGALVIALEASLVIAVLLLAGVLTGMAAAVCSLIFLAPLGYLLGVAAGVARMPGQRGLGDRLRSAAALITMHLSWGSGFLTGLVKGGGASVDRSRAVPR